LAEPTAAVGSIFLFRFFVRSPPMKVTFKTNIGRVDWKTLKQESKPPREGETVDLADDVAAAVTKRGWADRAADKAKKAE
jgi:hypothetical protein